LRIAETILSAAETASAIADSAARSVSCSSGTAASLRPDVPPGRGCQSGERETTEAVRAEFAEAMAAKDQEIGFFYAKVRKGTQNDRCRRLRSGMIPEFTDHSAVPPGSGLSGVTEVRPG